MDEEPLCNCGHAAEDHGPSLEDTRVHTLGCHKCPCPEFAGEEEEEFLSDDDEPDDQEAESDDREDDPDFPLDEPDPEESDTEVDVTVLPASDEPGS